MTKEEKIKEALGDLYQYADNNGWIPFAFSITRSLKDSDLDKTIINDKLVIRHKSLQGIENNNGWIKVESESDLPKEEDDYHICIENKDLSIAYFDKSDGWFISCQEITYYQPIIKPELPIY